MGRPAAASRPPCNFASCAAPLIGTGIGASRWANKLACAAPRDVKNFCRVLMCGPPRRLWELVSMDKKYPDPKGRGAGSDDESQNK